MLEYVPLAVNALSIDKRKAVADSTSDHDRQVEVIMGLEDKIGKGLKKVEEKLGLDPVAEKSEEQVISKPEVEKKPAATMPPGARDVTGMSMSTTA